MISESETLMQHWAEQTRRCGMEASLSVTSRWTGKCNHLAGLRKGAFRDS